MASREFELVIAAPRDAICEDFYAPALAEWNPDAVDEGSELIVDDLPFAWTMKTPEYEVGFVAEPMGEATALTIKVTAGMFKVGGFADRQRKCFEKLRVRAEERAG